MSEPGIADRIKAWERDGAPNRKSLAAFGLRLKAEAAASAVDGGLRERHYRTPLVDNLHPVTDFVRAAVASEPELAWPGEIDTIIDDAESFEEELLSLASSSPGSVLDGGLDVERLAKAYEYAEATVRTAAHAGHGEPFWRVFAREYAALESESE